MSPGAAHLEDAALGVDVGDTKHDDSPPEVVHCGAGGRVTAETSWREPPRAAQEWEERGSARGPHRHPGTEGRRGPRAQAVSGPLGEQEWLSSGKALGKGEPRPLTEVDSLGHFASSHGQQDGPTAVLAGLGRGGRDSCDPRTCPL